jgi:hypothetical protein
VVVALLPQDFTDLATGTTHGDEIDGRSVEGCADRNEGYFGTLYGCRQVRGRGQGPAHGIAKEIIEPALEYRRPRRIERLDSSPVYIDTGHLMALGRKTHARDQPNVPGSND